MLKSWACGLFYISVSLELSACVGVNSRIRKLSMNFLYRGLQQACEGSLDMYACESWVYTDSRSAIVLGLLFLNGAYTHLALVCICVCVCVNLESRDKRKWLITTIWQCLQLLSVQTFMMKMADGISFLYILLSFVQSTRAVVNFFFSFLFIAQNVGFYQTKWKTWKLLIEYYANISYLIMILPVYSIIRTISHYSILLASASGTHHGGGQVWYHGISLSNVIIPPVLR